MVIFLTVFEILFFGTKTCFKTFKRNFSTTKNYADYPAQNTNFDPHAAKALTINYGI
jgi:hypothetical protein